MDNNAITLTVSRDMALISLVFQIWMIVFPILILRKLNYLIAVIEDQFGSNQDSNEQNS